MVHATRVKRIFIIGSHLFENAIVANTTDTYIMDILKIILTKQIK